MGFLFDLSIKEPMIPYKRQGKLISSVSISLGLRRTIVNMVPKSLIRLLLCCAFYIVIHSLVPRALAMKRPSDLEDYLIGERRSRKRQNYMEKIGLENELFENIEEVGPTYDTKSKDLEKANNLPSFILDYANMIRNDIILLDNSVETRTRKRGNIKVRNQMIPDPPCNCIYNKDMVDLGEDYFPRFVENRNCSEEMCLKSYKCQSNIYDLTVLKKRRSPLQESTLDLPTDLEHRWIAERQSVTIGCTCTKNYSINNRV